jgi:hypothetical protein
VEEEEEEESEESEEEEEVAVAAPAAVAPVGPLLHPVGYSGPVGVGDAVLMQGSGKNPYKVKNVGNGIWSCQCQNYKMVSVCP